MAEIDEKTKIIEDYEPLLDLRAAFVRRDKAEFDSILKELSDELSAEYKSKLTEKIERWADSTVVPRFYDRPPVRSYIQAKMLYRDGFFEATIMVARSIAEMICYDRLEGASHSFGSVQEIEKQSFRKLVKWLHENDKRLTAKAYKQLNDLYDLGNNYVHPKTGQDPKNDSLIALHLIGESVFEVYGVRTVQELIGRTVRTPYTDFPDICSGTNFMLPIYTTPEAAMKSKRGGH